MDMNGSLEWKNLENVPIVVLSNGITRPGVLLMKTKLEIEATKFEIEVKHKKWKKRFKKRMPSVVVTFNLPPDIINRIDRLIYSGLVMSRSEFFRTAVIWKLIAVFPLPSFFLYDVKKHDEINMKIHSFKLPVNFRKLLQSIGPTVKGGYSCFIRMSVIELLELYEKLVHEGGLINE